MNTSDPSKFAFLLCMILSTYLPAQTQQGGFIDQWDTYATGEFGPVLVQFDATDMIDIDTVPEVGVHPRIYFGPGDVADIATKLASTTSGQEAFAQLHAYTTLLNLGYGANGTYNHNSSYGSDAFGNKRIDNAGKWDRSVTYDALAANDATALDGVSTKDRYLLASEMALEAFECLIMTGQTDPDTGLDYDNRAAKLGQAMSNWAQLVIGDPDLNWQNYNYFGGVHMAYAYDLNYNSMTTDQQDSVRLALSYIIPPTPRYGSELDHYATTSNWVGLNSFELLTNFAIEGELGYNTTLTHDYMRAYWNFITYGWYESGTPYEGLGKNYQFVTTLVAAAKRGYSLLPHPHVRAYGSDFLTKITQPYGHSFIGTDVWGGTGWDDIVGGYKNNAADILGLKHILPDDENIDFVWRNYIEEWYKIDSQGYVYQSIEPATSGYHNYLLTAAIFAEDYTTGDWEAQNAEAQDSLSHVSPERGLVTLRSDYTDDALLVHFHARQDMGGHTHGDRNNIAISGLGRVWFRYTYGSHFQPTEYHSCLLIDGAGVPLTYKDGVKARQPGKLLSYTDTGLAAQAVGDATYAYNWEWHWETQSSGVDHSYLDDGGAWTPVTETWNDFRYHQGSEPYHNLAFYDYGHWNVPNKLERIIKQPANDLEKVYRSVTMVRGQQPYVIVADDIAMNDGQPHNYKWLGQVANDLALEQIVVDLYGSNFRNDLILGESGGSRKLLVRVLNNGGQCTHDLVLSGVGLSGQYAAADEVISDEVISGNQDVNYKAGQRVNLNQSFETPASTEFLAEIEPCLDAPGYVEVVDPDINGNSPITRLVLESDVVSPDYKVMLYPYVDGDALPVTTWNPDRTVLTVSWSGGSETITFGSVNGMTTVEVN